MPRNAAETKIPTLLVTWPIWPCPSLVPRRKPRAARPAPPTAAAKSPAPIRSTNGPSDSPSQIAARCSAVSRMKNPATTIANAPMPTA